MGWAVVTRAMASKRIVTVDFLRGLLAVGVLFYHTMIYEGGPALPQIGRYGVYAFFVISGFALYTSYRDRLGSAAEVRAYFVARFWRIAPLYYTAVILSVAAFGVTGLSLTKVFLNVSLLFGFANPGETTMVVGGWSIGIEVAFYALFPVIVIACNGLSRFAAATAILLVAQVIFANHILAGTTIVEAWNAYTQPLCFAGYFVAGCLLAEVYRQRPEWKGSPASWSIFGVALLAFIVAPRDSEAILTGPVGIVMTVSALSLVAGTAFLPEPQGTFRRFAEWLGGISYPIYLLHPIVYNFASKVPIAGAHIPLTLLATVALSHLVNRAIERPALRFAKSMIAAKP